MSGSRLAGRPGNGLPRPQLPSKIRACDHEQPHRGMHGLRSASASGFPLLMRPGRRRASLRHSPEQVNAIYVLIVWRSIKQGGDSSARQNDLICMARIAADHFGVGIQIGRDLVLTGTARANASGFRTERLRAGSVRSSAV